MKVKLVFISILAIIFVMFFGLPSLRIYRTNNTLISEKKVKFMERDVPAITIAAAEKNSGENAPHGWREDLKENGLRDMTGQFCNKSLDFNETIKCMDEKTFSLSEVVEDVTSLETSLMGEEFWRSDFFNFYFGKVFTLHSLYHLGTDWENSLLLHLNPSMSYYVWIHDKDFFLTSINQDVIPHYFLRMDHKDIVFLVIRPVNYHMMDKDDQRCNPSESYSFTRCVKNSVSKQIGCRLPWDQWSSGDIDICSTKNQIRQFEEKFYNINEIWEQSEIVNYTGCLIPCHYTSMRLQANHSNSRVTGLGLGSYYQAHRSTPGLSRVFTPLHPL